MIKAFIVVNNHGTSPRLHDASVFHSSTPRPRGCHRVSASVLAARGLSNSAVTDDLVLNPPFPAAMVRLCRFYEQLGVDKQTELCQTVYKIVTGRPDHLCSFVDDEKTFGPDTKLVYRHFATLYFCILSDRSESELAMLDLIQVYVETLDRVFENVCELDLIFNSPKAYTVLDETIVGGLVLEINSQKILGVYDNLMKLEKANSSIMDKLV